PKPDPHVPARVRSGRKLRGASLRRLDGSGPKLHVPGSFRMIDFSHAYRALQREMHPDRYAAGDEVERRLALQSSARVNEAYRALKDPVGRAQYLLSLRGIDALAETDTQLPLDFLEHQ